MFFLSYAVAALKIGLFLIVEHYFPLRSSGNQISVKVGIIHFVGFLDEQMLDIQPPHKLIT